MRIAAPQSDRDWRHARELVEEYAQSLDVDLSFQDFAHEVEHLEAEYGPPTGRFLLADANGIYLGCVAIRRFEVGVGEIKRLYVRPAARGLGLGRQLAEAIVAAATDLGCSRVLLDTLPSMTNAQALYRSLGFTPTAPYRFNPVRGTTFLELRLHQD